MLQSMVLQSWTRLSNWTELTSEKNHLALERSWEPSIYIWRWSSRLRLWQHSLLADDQKSGMKTGKRWCKRNPGRKEFREVKEGYQGWYLRSAEINPSCGQLGLAFRSSVQQVQGSVEVQRCHSLHLPLSVTLGSLPVGFRFLSPRWAALGQEPVVLTSVTPAPHTHTHTPWWCFYCWVSCLVVFDPAAAWTVVLQAPLSMGFSRQEHWSGLPFPTPEDLPDPRIEATSLVSPSLSGGFFTASATWEALSRDKAGRKEMRSLSLWGLCSKAWIWRLRGKDKSRGNQRRYWDEL